MRKNVEDKEVFELVLGPHNVNGNIHIDSHVINLNYLFAFRDLYNGYFRWKLNLNFLQPYGRESKSVAKVQNIKGNEKSCVLTWLPAKNSVIIRELNIN